MQYVCRICLKVINDLNFVAAKTDAASQIEMQLSFCVPEMVVELVNDSVLCKSCVSALDATYNFKNLCLCTEEHIKTLKTLTHKSIDIRDVLYRLQQLTNGVCEDNGEVKSTREGFLFIPNTNVMLPEEVVTNGQNLNTETKTSRHLVTSPVDAFKKIINSKNFTTNSVNKPAVQTPAYDLCSLVVQPLVYKQEVKNEYKDITIDEDLSLPKVEPSWSYDGYENNSLDDTKSKDCTTDDRACFQTNIVIQNCFVKLTRLPDNISYNNENKSFYKCDRCSYNAKSTSQLPRHSVQDRARTSSHW